MTEGTQAQERFALIQENLAEVMNPEILEKILAEGRNPKIYWGEDAPTLHFRHLGRALANRDTFAPQEPRRRAGRTAATSCPPSSWRSSSPPAAR